MRRNPSGKRATYRRADRVADAIRRELGMLLLREMSDPRLRMATVTAVDVSPDIQFARVHVGVLGAPEEQAEALAAIEAAAGFIRKRLGERLDLRALPEIRFRLDHSAERAQRLSDLFRDLAAKREKVDLPELLALLPGVKRCLVLAHEHPEGDAIGSTLALGLALEEMGKTVSLYNADPVPEVLRFLPGAERISRTIEDADAFDAVFMLDCGAFDRVGQAAAQALAAHRTVINIDHHETNERFGRLNLVRPEASSTGEILYGILKEAGHAISEPVAINLYAAVFTDTGGLQNAAATPAAFRILADLVEAGANPPEIARRVYHSLPARRQILLGRVLSTVRIDAEGRIGSAFVTRAMFEETGTTPEDLEGFVEEVNRIDGLRVAVLLREDGETRIKVSMRSKDDFDVARIASQNGGGGHRAAAGCTIEGAPLDLVRERIIEQIRRGLE